MPLNLSLGISLANSTHVNGFPAWVPEYAAFFIDALNDRAWIQNTQFGSLASLASNAPFASFSRSTAGLYLASNNIWQTFASGQIRRGDRGMLVESASTNGFKNSSFAGVATGLVSAGANAPNAIFASQGNPTINRVLTLANGLPALEFAWSYNNTSGAAQYPRFSIAVADMPLSSAGQLWNCSAYVDIVSSTHALSLLLQERDAAGGYLTGTPAAVSSSGFYALNRTLTHAGAAKVEWAFGPTVNNGETLAATVRIAAPQVELGSKRTSPILTPQNQSATRAADILTIRPEADDYDITVTFDDNSTQVISAQTVTPSGWTLPANLARPYIKSIAGYRA
jgi:hypothetical protein